MGPFGIARLPGGNGCLLSKVQLPQAGNWAFLFAWLVPFLSPIVLKQGTSMFEPLISSRIRRSLVDYLLTHPNDKFYLRGLAKELNLSVSPLRRELKKLQQAGLLTSFHEANILYYVVNAASPLLHQLQQAVSPQLPLQEKTEPVVSAGIPSPLPISARNYSFRFGFLASAAVVLVAGLAVGVAALSLKNRNQKITVVLPSSSGIMRGHHWQVVPGSMGGGFSHGANDESY